jgi:hypothetical protein
MSFLVPFLIVLSVVIAAKLSGEGVSLRKITIGCTIIGFAGLMMFINGINSVAPELAATGDPGRIGRVGILFILSALFAGITIAIIALIRVMSASSKG